jgi:DNA polymerase bacteriophage-type
MSSCLRGFLKAPPGKKLIAGDFSAIEARVLAWLAGEESVLEIFRTHGKIYEHTAASIYSVPMDQVTKAQRQVGKVAELALGYQGGVGAFQSMAKNYDVTMAPVFNDLRRVATPQNRIICEKMWSMNAKKAEKSGLSRQEYMASELTKLAWRDSHPNTVAYWTATEEAAISAVRNPKKPFKVGPAGREVTYLSTGSFLWAQLPSKGMLSYPYPRIQEITTPWDAKKDGLTYMGEDSTTHQFARQKTYGGSLVENNTQSFSRDLLKDAMLRLRHQDYKIVLHCHDEVVAEVPDCGCDLKFFEDTMAQVPDYAKGLPIKAEGWLEERYRK